MDKTYDYFLAFFRTKVKELGLSQAQVAAAIDRDAGYINKILNCKAKAGIKLQEKIAIWFGLDLAEIYNAGKIIAERPEPVQERDEQPQKETPPPEAKNPGITS
jgi:transcriptional regulator with XRE-family HTH domain